MKESEKLALDNQICFLLYTASREIIRLYTPLLSELGVTYPQYLVLLLLWEKDGLIINELGERLHLDSGTLTPLLKRMEKEKIINRRRSSEDERKVEIFLTEKGAAIKEKAGSIPDSIFCKSGLTPDSYNELKKNLTHLLNFTGPDK